MSLKKLLEEEAAIDKEFFNRTDDPAEPANDQTLTTPNVDQKITTEPLEDLQGSRTDSVEEETYKKRFTNYKASTDKTISTLRKENLEFINQLHKRDEEINRLREYVSNLERGKNDPFLSVITQEDIDSIGPEAVDIIKKTNQKATESAIEPLKREIETLKAKELQNIKQQAVERQRVAYSNFTKDLKALVSDYEVINVDKGFETFMLQEDPSTGEQRLEAFRRAEEYLDASRVADFFKEYKSSIPRSKREVLEDKQTPEGNSSVEPIAKSGKKETYTIQEVNRFFDDVAKGLYKNKKKEAEEIEARITKAYIDGKIEH